MHSEVECFCSGRRNLKGSTNFRQSRSVQELYRAMVPLEPSLKWAAICTCPKLSKFYNYCRRLKSKSEHHFRVEQSRSLERWRLFRVELCAPHCHYEPHRRRDIREFTRRNTCAHGQASMGFKVRQYIP